MIGLIKSLKKLISFTMKCTENKCKFPVTCKHHNKCMQSEIDKAELRRKQRNEVAKEGTNV